MSKVTFPQLINVYRELEFDQESKSGTLTLSSQDLRDTVASLLLEDNIDESGLSIVSGDPDNLEIGQTIHLNVTEPRIGLGVLARDLNSLLKTRKACIEERKYFLIDTKFASSDLTVPADVECYRNLLKFIKLLKEAAAYLESEREELIFIHDGKFTLPVKYDFDDLMNADFSAMKKIQESFINDTHREQKLSILADTIIALVKGEPSIKKFRYMLANLPEFYSKFSDGYRLFASSFSYSKIRSQLESTQIEYTGKIHKVFTDIQNQMLTIPVATVIVATQMKTDAFWVNTAVLIGCWIFVLLVSLLVWNQKHTLEVLKQDIDRQKNLIKNDYKNAPNFDDIFEKLEKRLCLQKFILFIICGVLLIGLVLANIVYFIFTPDAWAWLTQFIISCS